MGGVGSERHGGAGVGLPLANIIQGAPEIKVNLYKKVGTERANKSNREEIRGRSSGGGVLAR